MDPSLLSSAMQKLQDQFPSLNWSYHDVSVNDRTVKMYFWPGSPDEEIVITVHKSSGEQELFHRHDFFYFNYTYQGQYDSLSHRHDHRITIHEKELYAGQPLAGHALCVHDNQETLIVGVLVQKESFLRLFLPSLSSNARLLHFFLAPVTEPFADEFIHFKIEDDDTIRLLLDMMVIEYANKREDTQAVLKPMALSFFMQVARQYSRIHQPPSGTKLSEQILQYIGEHFDTVSLQKISRHFSYHPNYISTLLRKETGRSFSELLLAQRMERAEILLRETSLPICEIAQILGYTNPSNFYKAFKKAFHTSPREYLNLKVQ